MTIKFPKTKVAHKRNPATKDVFFAFLAVEEVGEEQNENEEDEDHEEAHHLDEL